MRMGTRLTLVVIAGAILAFGARFALRTSAPLAGWTGYAPLSEVRLGGALMDQGPLRVGVAMVSAVVATVMLMIAVRRVHAKAS
jgi:heme/copper-type cytochrome/quinol oxidase subunit 1